MRNMKAHSKERFIQLNTEGIVVNLMTHINWVSINHRSVKARCLGVQSKDELKFMQNIKK